MRNIPNGPPNTCAQADSRDGPKPGQPPYQVCAETSRSVIGMRSQSPCGHVWCDRRDHRERSRPFLRHEQGQGGCSNFFSSILEIGPFGRSPVLATHPQAPRDCATSTSWEKAEMHSSPWVPGVAWSNGASPLSRHFHPSLEARGQIVEPATPGRPFCAPTRAGCCPTCLDRCRGVGLHSNPPKPLKGSAI